MKRIIFSLVMLLIVTGVFAEGFEFIGIRSGMTKEEVKMVIEYDKLSVEGSYNNPKSRFDEDEEIVFGEELYSDKTYSNKFTDYPAYMIEFLFTEDNILWKIQIITRRPNVTDKFYSINKEAQLKAIKKTFPNAEFIESEIYSNGNSNLYIVLIDNTVYNSAVNKKTIDYLSLYKN